ncbi:hypothetical protein [Fusobacterium necrophorum]|uniref:hypothetical protein n=1 Tax=Fusobacterium necrophorum TaxID=859 RepID=UPI000A8DCA8D|nr:hypothetical protein [Fusobacterium necrophorum]MCF0161530.1 hypothetical protein [Fusobacterium necrophorum]MDK4473525.1 hypothetical protein [Fusobacterium necrophorum]MDY2573209.1 hypothetical protein [Fusobacterium necrophorum]
MILKIVYFIILTVALFILGLGFLPKDGPATNFSEPKGPRPKTPEPMKRED